MVTLDKGRPHKSIQLKAFRRVELKPNQQRQVVFRLSPQQLSRYVDSVWVVAPGQYEMLLASSSTDVRLRTTIELVDSIQSFQRRTIMLADQE